MFLFRRVRNEGEFWMSFDDFAKQFSHLDLVSRQDMLKLDNLMISAVKRSIGFTIGFHNHGEGPCRGPHRDCETDGSF